MPFNWRTPLGYTIAFLDELIADTVGVLTYVPLMSFFIGSCWTFIFFIKDITTNDLPFLGIDVRSKNRCVESKKRFCKIVNFYADAKGLIGDLNRIYRFILTVFFAWSVINICMMLLVLTTEIDVS